MRIKLAAMIPIPEKVEVKLENGLLTAKGPKGECGRMFIHPLIKIEIKDRSIVVACDNATKREKTMFYTFVAHIKNILKGADEGFVFKLKICPGHFPMNVGISNNVLSIKNFLGEKVPRKVALSPSVKVRIEGDIIVVESVDKELGGQTAAAIEQATRITKRDRRIFQDGIYITEKAGKAVNK